MLGGFIAFGGVSSLMGPSVEPTQYFGSGAAVIIGLALIAWPEKQKK
jgi:hypothetical protein